MILYYMISFTLSALIGVITLIVTIFPTLFVGVLLYCVLCISVYYAIEQADRYINVIFLVSKD